MAPRNKQQELALGKDFESRREHGGDLNENRRKLKRPLDPRQSLHVVMRSKRARGEWSFLHRRNRAGVEKILYTHAVRNQVTIERLANVGNHLHLLLRFRARQDLQRFFRTVAGLIPRAITGAQKGLRRGRFWDAPVYTRLVTWGRELKAVCAYLAKNRLEAIGFRGARLKFSGRGLAVVVVGRLHPSGRERDWEFLTAEQRRLATRDARPSRQG